MTKNLYTTSQTTRPDQTRPDQTKPRPRLNQTSSSQQRVSARSPSQSFSRFSVARKRKENIDDSGQKTDGEHPRGLQ
ncbi:hypothetical protein V1477_020902 [Vespula maculifrons]|uniref:Uncharacterized protein n=1 Tax=Vespula maculifrons TaxID=7453 RepID=A0ABD2AN90_VESMC